MALLLLRESSKKLLKPGFFRNCIQRAHIADHERSIIGKREIVGWGYSGQPFYMDRPDFPFPAIRWKEPCAETDALREKEKGDWSELSCAEKKALYRVETVLVEPEELEEGQSSAVLRNILEHIKRESLDDEQYDLVNSLHVEINEDLGDENDWTEFPLIDASESSEILPPKSKLKYEAAYKVFQQWCKERNIEGTTENVLLQYFSEKSKILKSSTLWAQFSMLKATMIINDNVDIGNFKRLTTLLKLNYKGYVPNKSRIFTKEEIQTFLKEAPDETYLMIKVALIIGISGGCRRDELAQLTIDDIEDLGAALLIKIPDEKTKIQRTFTVIPEKEKELNCLEIYRKYRSLRPPDLRLNHRRLFLSYRLGKCSSQVVGVNTFGKIPSRIAKYLQLPEPYSYNGHCFRRSSASLTKNEKFF